MTSSNGSAPVDVEELGAQWHRSLDAAQSALTAAHTLLGPDDVREHAHVLAVERKDVVHLLQVLARDRRATGRFSHLAVAQRDVRRLLGLAPDVTACIFNLDGVLVGSATVHAAAWRETFDRFLVARGERTGGAWVPFDPIGDYYRCIHGKPRLDGVRAFLESRGIRLEEGAAQDPPGAETVHGLANAKRDALVRRLSAHTLSAFEGSRHYLEIARDAGVHRAVISASANARLMLEGAGLTTLVEDCVDGTTMAQEHLRAKPEADTLLAACARLGVEPAHAAAFETTRAGVTAARLAGFELVIGVDADGNGARELEEADRVVTGLADLLAVAA